MARSRRRPVVALASGGLDSLVLVRRLLASGAVVHPVYVRCGLRWEAAELAALRRWLAPPHRAGLAQTRPPRLKPLAVLELPVRSLYGRHWSVAGRVPSASSRDAAVYLPGRNIFLLGQAAVYAALHGAGRVAVGTLAANPFGDAAPEFFHRYAQVLSQALAPPHGAGLGRRVAIEAPLRRLTKAQLIASDPSAPYRLTLSCLAPVRGRHCGRCNKCAERRRAFRAAGVADPTRCAA